MNNKKQGILTYKTLAVLTVIMQVITLAPILYCAHFNYATGDDLGYSAGIHRVMAEGGSLSDIISVMWQKIVTSWYTFQGTWSSIFLFQLQPGIWGEHVYRITTYLALFCIIAGTAYVLYQIFVRALNMSKAVFVIIFNLELFLMIQYIPKIRGGLFWYTSIAHYIIPYLAAMLVCGLSITFMRKGKAAPMILMVLLMAYLGGAGYPLVVLAAAWVFFLIVGVVTGIIEFRDCSDKKAAVKRALLLLIPLVVEMAGFAVSAAAPGNKVRGGSDFGFSMGRVFGTIASSAVQTFAAAVGSVNACRLLPVVILFIGVIAWCTARPERAVLKLKYPIICVITAFIIACAVRMPEIYAGVEVSGGVPDVEYFAMLNMLIIAEVYVIYAVRKKLIAKGTVTEERDADDRTDDGSLHKAVMISATAAIIFTVVFARHLVGQTADYLCINYIRSGQIYDFEEQMKERLKILNDDSIMDAVVPEMNPEQGPIMHMALTDDPDQFTNDATARYYGKNSVIALPREQIK